MKKNLLIVSLLLLITFLSNGQITGITPNQGYAGQMNLSTTISSNSLFFQSSSSNGNLYQVYLQQGAYSFYLLDILGWSVSAQADITDPDNAVITGSSIPAGAMPGYYDLYVLTADTADPFLNQQILSLPGAFSLGSPDGYVQGTVYLDSNQNGIKDGGEPFLANETLRILPGNFTVVSDSVGNYSIPSFNGSYTVSWEYNLNAYMILSSDSASYSVTVNNDTVSGKDFGLIYSLASATPNQGYPGQSVDITVISRNMFVTGSQWGNINYSQLLFNGAPYSNAPTTSTYVFNADSARIRFNFYSNAAVGLYTLKIQTYNAPFSKMNYLPDAFQVISNDGAIKGNVYNDANLNGIKDAGESGIYSQKIRIMPDNIVTLTDGVGNFTVGAANGSHTVIWEVDSSNFYMLNSLPASYSVTVNSDTLNGNDFGLINGLISSTPNADNPGHTVTALISARGIFTTGAQQGNINSISLKKSFYTINASFSSITAIDSNTAAATFIIPSSSSYLGNYELDVSLNNNTLTCKLPNAFNVYAYTYSAAGTVYYDLNGNGVFDTGEPPLSQRVLLTPDSIYYYSYYNGGYAAGYNSGSHTVAWTPYDSQFVLSTGPASYSISGNQNYTGFDFGLITTNAAYASDIYFYNYFPRCNTDVAYHMNYTNNGPIVTNGKIIFKKDPQMTYVSSSVAPTQFIGDSIVWMYTNLLPFTWQNIDVTFHLPGAGSSVYNYAAIEPYNGSAYILMDSMSYNQSVNCSFDPNDKSVLPEGVQNPHYTLMNDELEYLIRFQNTGTDTAFNVTIVDFIDEDLDRNSFRVVNSSDSVNTELKNNGEVIFHFNNILLPDSNTNEPESHGYVRYSISPKTGLPNYTEVNNTAYIIFDSNSSVATNTTLNTLVNVIPSAVTEITKPLKGAIIFPDPFDNTAKLIFDNPGHQNYILTIKDINNKVMEQLSGKSSEFLLKKNNLRAGMYFYELSNDDYPLIVRGKFIIR